MQAYMSVVFEYWEENMRLFMHFCKLLFIKGLKTRKIQGIYFEISALYFKIYGLYFLQDALCFFACPHLVVYAKRKRVRMCRKNFKKRVIHLFLSYRTTEE